MKHSKLLPYEAPCTLVTCILTEGSVCGSATVTNPNAEHGKIENQEINTDFGYEFSEGDKNLGGWDEVTSVKN